MAHAKSANPNDFILPDLGEGVHEAELIKWRVNVGDAVKEHDILAEMETDKALVEVPSPRDGVIAALHGSEGEILRVGNPLVSYVPAGGAAASAAAEPKPASKPANNGTHAAHDHSAEADVPARTEDDGTVVGKMSGELGGVSAAEGKVLATPAVRRLARDLGVDLTNIAGTGIAGRITEKDVRSASSGSAAGSHAAPARPAAPSSPAPAAPAPATRHSVPAPRQPVEVRSAPAVPPPARREVPSIPPGEATLRVPFRGVRRTIANRLRESVNQAVHFNVMDEADISSLDSLRKKLSAATGEKISVLPFVASAVCRVLTRDAFRAMNATVDERPDDPNHEAAIVQHRAVHLGIATDTDSGLMVPVIRDCDALGVIEIARQIAHVADSARSRTAAREMLSGSTFTISNVGSHAGRFATPIINYPEAGILGVGRARQAPVIRNGGIFVGNLLPLSLACDHRVVDGATAALALAEIIALLQEPEQLLTPARG
ncbi:MAG: 2-oxo acid dehydrogenase subunit E2 [Phycisphaeraceae bacterium]|nr:2-oxo acid dehydrogenase subunit E2 [Phycisphaeraceae bacterium]